MRWDRVKILLFCLGFWFVAILAYAQPMGFVNSARQETTPAGLYASMWNATGSQINAGTVVMTDTVAASAGQQIPLGKGFTTWDATASHLNRVVGVLLEDCPGYSSRKVLVRGTINRVLLQKTGIAAFSELKCSLSVSGALDSRAASETTYVRQTVPVGVFQRYVDGTSLYGQAFVDFTGIISAAR